MPLAALLNARGKLHSARSPCSAIFPIRRKPRRERLTTWFSPVDYVDKLAAAAWPNLAPPLTHRQPPVHFSESAMITSLAPRLWNSGVTDSGWSRVPMNGHVVSARVRFGSQELLCQTQRPVWSLYRIHYEEVFSSPALPALRGILPSAPSQETSLDVQLCRVCRDRLLLAR